MIFELITKRSIENPNTSLSDPANWLVEWLTGGKTATGINVSQENALKFSAVWGCIRILSESVAMLPLNLYRTDGRFKEIVRDHPAHRLMNEPNEDMTSFVFRETEQAHVTSWGNSYAYIRRNGAFKPIELIPLLPNKTSSGFVDGKRKYIATTDDGQIVIDPIDVLHIPGLGFDGLSGYSPIAMHKESIGLGLASQEFGARFFGNGATLQGVLEHPNKLDDQGIARLKKQWNEAHQGTIEAHGTAVLEQGMKYQRIGIPPEEAQFLETRKFQITDIARIYRIPPHMLADLERATFTNIEQQDLNFVKHTMIPWLVRWEQELNRKLLSERDKQNHYFKFNVEGLLRGDSQARSQFYREMTGIGAYSINDVREKEDENPIEGGDEYRVPLNTAPVGAENDNEPDPEPEDDERLLKFISTEAYRLAHKEMTAFKREASRKAGLEYDKWLNEFFEKHAKEIMTKLHVTEEKALEYIEGMKRRIENGIDNWEEISRNELIELAKVQ